MSDVFISYSRKDKIFARRLFDRLKSEKYSSWVDWIGIPYSSEWMNEIREGIIQTDNFVFIISQDSLISKVCNLELEIARQHNKRIIPIVRSEPNIKLIAGEWFGKEWESIARTNWEKLTKLNFIFFRKKIGFDCEFDENTGEIINPDCDDINSDADNFETRFTELLKTVRENPQHARQHTRYLLRAEDWKTTGENEDSLLIGSEIGKAEIWLREWEKSKIERALQMPPLEPIEPIPLPLHYNYISASRRADSIRIEQLNNIREQIKQAENRAESLRLASESSNILNEASLFPPDYDTHRDFELATLLAIQALNTSYTAQADEALVRALDKLIPTKNSMEHIGLISQVIYSPDGNFIISASWDKTLCLWNANTGEKIHSFNGHTDDVNAVACSPDGNFIVSASSDKTLRLWEIKTGNTIQILRGHVTSVDAVAFSPNGEFITSGSFDGMICIWHSRTGELIHSFKENSVKAKINSITYSIDGKMIIYTSWIYIYIHDALTFEIRNILNGHDLDVFCIACSPNGIHIASGSYDDTIRIWDLKTKETIKIIKPNIAGIDCIAYSPNGQKLAFASQIGKIQILDTLTWDIQRIIGGRSYKLAFNPNKPQIVVSTFDNMVKICDTDYHNLISYACTKVSRDISIQERQHYSILNYTPVCQRFESKFRDIIHQLFERGLISGETGYESVSYENISANKFEESNQSSIILYPISYYNDRNDLECIICTSFIINNSPLEYGCGFAIRFDEKDFYAIFINTEKHLLFSAYISGKWENIKNIDISSTINNKDLNTKLMLIVKGEIFQTLINDEVIADFSDSRLKSGYISLFIQKYNRYDTRDFLFTDTWVWDSTPFSKLPLIPMTVQG